MNLSKLKIGIIGLGLIGGSILKNLAKKGFAISAIANSEKTYNKVLDFTKMFPQTNITISNSISELKKCSLIFVCVPMNKTIEILDILDNELQSNTIVTDVCSLKSFVCTKKRNYTFIPSHPMAGTEFSGFENSFDELFQGAKWVLTPFNKTNQQDINILTDIIKIFGADIIQTTPQAHDEAVAMISHMPMLISQALYKTATNNELALKLASSGFRDMTRLALSNTEMASDMINFNSKNIQKSLLQLYTSVGNLLNQDYKSQIEKIKTSRNTMFSPEGKNIL